MLLPQVVGVESRHEEPRSRNEKDEASNQGRRLPTRSEQPLPNEHERSTEGDYAVASLTLGAYGEQKIGNRNEGENSR